MNMFNTALGAANIITSGRDIDAMEALIKEKFETATKYAAQLYIDGEHVTGFTQEVTVTFEDTSYAVSRSVTPLVEKIHVYTLSS